MFGEWSYMAMLAFVLVASGWLEFAFKIRVWRNPIQLFGTVLIVAPVFVVWDAKGSVTSSQSESG
ncbi:MAG: hypothetical protein RL718_575 [Actinomycetota bacterium]|jgi:hypothetical protein